MRIYKESSIKKKRRRKEGRKNTRITRRALVFCAFSLRLLDLDSSGLRALILALPVQQALRRVSLTSFPADADATSPVCERDLTNERMCMRHREEDRDEDKEGATKTFHSFSLPDILAATKNLYLVQVLPLYFSLSSRLTSSRMSLT